MKSSQGYKILGLLGLIFLFSCGEKKDSSVQEEIVIQDSIPTDSTQNLDHVEEIEGVYKGTLPCADCEGIKMEIKLNDDDTYIYSTQYIGKDKEMMESTGTYEFLPDGQTIVLSSIHNAPNKFKIVNNELVQLDMEGKPVTGPNATKYVLKK